MNDNGTDNTQTTPTQTSSDSGMPAPQMCYADLVRSKVYPPPPVTFVPSYVYDRPEITQLLSNNYEKMYYKELKQWLREAYPHDTARRPIDHKCDPSICEPLPPPIKIAAKPSKKWRDPGPCPCNDPNRPPAYQPFVPSYESTPTEIGPLLGCQYERVWYKERDAWALTNSPPATKPPNQGKKPDPKTS